MLPRSATVSLAVDLDFAPVPSGTEIRASVEGVELATLVVPELLGDFPGGRGWDDVRERVLGILSDRVVQALREEE